MAEIKLASGEVALVDGEDFALVSQHKWHLLKSRKGDQTGYAATSIRHKRGKPQRTILMHHVVFGEKIRLDHENGNKLDNRKRNLRPASGSQNAGNSKDRAGSSKFKGVSWPKRDQIWQANLMTTMGGKAKLCYLGRFKREEDAAAAYRQAAIKYFGQFARF